MIEIRRIKKDVNYFEFYDSFYSDIKALFDWPLTMAEMTKPCILPSGITIQEDCWDELIKRKCKDPYNKDLKIKQKIVNRFAIEVREIIDKSEKFVANEVAKCQFYEERNSKEIEIQTDMLNKSNDDSSKIKV